MGNVRVITGRSGCGKTSYCINEFIKSLSQNRREDGRTASFLIVPEQFAVDYERKVLMHQGCSGLLGSEVISFNRLAFRILSDAAESVPQLLSQSGKAMLLVNAVQALSAELRYYKRCESNVKSIAGLLDTINEFMKYCVTPQMLEKAAELEKNDDVLNAKFHELSVIYAKFCQMLSSEYCDSSAVCRKAAELIKRGCDTVDGAVIWIDGFSGFTETELLMIKALSGQCAELNFCLFSDSDRNLIFSCPDRTCSDIIRIMTACGHRVKVENLQEKRGGSGGYQIPYENTRFAGCPAIGKIEESYGRIKKSTKSTSADISCDGVAVFRCTDIYREIENCADEIINLAAGGMKFSDIAVVSPNVDENAALFRAVFAKLKIPFFIDTKRDLSGHPVVRYILSFIDIVADDMPVKAVFTLLKTGLYKAEEYSPECIDLLENAAAASGAVNSAGWRRMCEKLASKYEKKGFATARQAPYGECLPPYVRLALDLYNCIYGKDGLAAELKSCRTVKDCAEATVKFAEASGLEASVRHTAAALVSGENTELSETYLRIWNIFTDVAEQAALFLGDVKIHGYKKLSGFFGDVLRAGLALYKVGFIPHTLQCVQIGNADRSRYIDKKAVFVIGANDGAFPSKFSEGGVLGDKERALLKTCGASLAYDSIERTYFAQFNVYTVLTSPSKRLFLSYSELGSDGNTLYPSPCISALHNIFKDLKEKEIMPELTADTYPYTDENARTHVKIDNKLAAELLKIGAECRMSVSRLEQYRMCPYEFFLRQCLKLKDIETGDVKSSSIGTYFHGLIEHSLKNSDFFKRPLEMTAVYKMVAAAAEEFLSEPENRDLYYLFESSAKNRMLQSRAENFAVHDVANLAMISDMTGFRPAAEECRFGSSELLPPVKIQCKDTTAVLRGIIDRIDIRETDSETQLCIVDYKSSRQAFSEADIDKGLKLQLFTYYMAVAQGVSAFTANADKPIVPSAVLYYIFGKNVEKTDVHSYSGFASPGVFCEKDDEPENKSRSKALSGIKQAELAELAETVKEHIISEINDISSGIFDVLPEKGNEHCRVCGCRSVCKRKKA